MTTYQAFMWDLDGDYHSRYILIGNVVVNIETPRDGEHVHTSVDRFPTAEDAQDNALAMTRVDENKGLVLDGEMLMCSLDTDLDALIGAHERRSLLRDQKVYRIVRSIQMGGQPLHFAADGEVS